MHEIQDERNTLPGLATASKECIGCMRMLPMICFPRDSSYRDGRRDLCDECATSPRLSIDEHTARLHEKNNNSEAVKKQRWADQEMLQGPEAERRGQTLHHAEFLLKLRTIAGSEQLYFTEGNIAGDIAIFRVYGQPQPRLEGRSFEYLFYMPTGVLPEFSIYEFNARDIPVREKQRGWRTVLLRLIKSRVVREEDVDHVFGKPLTGRASFRYRKELHNFRSNVPTQ